MIAEGWQTIFWLREGSLTLPLLPLFRVIYWDLSEKGSVGVANRQVRKAGGYEWQNATGDLHKIVVAVPLRWGA